jgi:hypothetical protein
MSLPMRRFDRSLLCRGVARALIMAFALLAACSTEQEREPIGGGGSPQADYCTKLGYSDDNGSCTFSNGTSCQDFLFFNGSCGQPFSYCEKQGGTISTLTISTDAGTGTESQCTTTSGATCWDYDYLLTGTCQ